VTPGKRKILMVDDDEDFVALVSTWLKHSRFEFSAVLTREDFLKKIQSFDPDLILLDIMLGADRGPDVLDEALREGFSSQIPVIFMSSLSENKPLESVPPFRKIVLHNKLLNRNLLINEIETLLQIK